MGLMEFTGSEVRAVRLACYISAFITPLLSTMMNLSLINIGENFDVGSHDLAYINSAFLLASVIFMVPFAKLADIVGKKKLFVIGLVIVVIGCFVACLAPSFWVVILGRAVIGVGASSLAMVSISILTDVVPLEKRGATIGYQTMFVYMGLSFGPAIGGALNDLVGWRILFLITVPMAVASTIIILTGFKKEIANDAGGSLDFKNSVVYGAAMLFSMGGVMNLPAAWAAVSVIIGLLLLALFVKSQINNSRCLLNMGLFKNWAFSGACLAAFMNYASSFSISFFLALYLQSIGGLTATEAGLLMIVQPVVQCMFTPYFGRMTDRIANKAILPTAGMILTSVCIMTYVFYSLDTPLYMPAISMMIGGFGFAMFSAPNTTLIMSSVPREHSSEASAVLSVMRQTGMMVSMGIAMTYITVIMGSTDNLGPETYGLFLQVLELSMITCFIMCIIGTMASISRGKPKHF